MDIRLIFYTKRLLITGIFELINGLGLHLSATGFLICSLLFLYRSPLANRVTIRTQPWISLLELIRHNLTIHAKDAHNIHDIELCYKFLAYDQICTFFFFVFALNLHLLFKYGPRADRSWELYSLIFIIMIISMTGLVFSKLNMFIKDQEGNCLIQNNLPGFFIKFYLIILPMFPSLTYCVLIFITTSMALHTRSIYIKPMPEHDRILYLGEKYHPIIFINHLKLRFGFASLTCLTNMFNYFIEYVLIASGYQIPLKLKYFNAILRRLSGIFNFLSIAFDPYIQKSFKRVWICFVDVNIPFFRLDDMRAHKPIDVFEDPMEFSDEEIDEKFIPEPMIQFRGGGSQRYNDYIMEL